MLDELRGHRPAAAVAHHHRGAVAQRERAGPALRGDRWQVDGLRLSHGWPPPRGDGSAAGRPGRRAVGRGSRRRRPPRSETMVAPSGLLGRAGACRTRGTRAGLIRPWRTSPLRHSAGSAVSIAGRRRTGARRRGRGRSSDSRRPLVGMHADARASCGRRPRRPRPASARAAALPVARDRPARTAFSTSCRPASSWRTARQDALEQVERLEAGDHDRHAVARGERRRTRSIPHHRADVAGGRGSPAPGCRATCRIASIAGGTRTCETSRRSSSGRAAAPRGPPARWRGAVVSKPTAKKTTSRSGVARARSCTASSGE